jgi:hypothetical protein
MRHRQRPGLASPVHVVDYDSINQQKHVLEEIFCLKRDLSSLQYQAHEKRPGLTSPVHVEEYDNINQQKHVVEEILRLKRDLSSLLYQAHEEADVMPKFELHEMLEFEGEKISLSYTLSAAMFLYITVRDS